MVDPGLGAVEEHLVEPGAAVGLTQRTHVHAGLVDRHADQRQPDVALGVGVGAAQQQDPVRPLRLGGPHLLPGDDESVPVDDGARAQRGEVRARLGFGEPLAPVLLAGEQRRQEASLLLGRAVGQQRRGDEALTDAEHDPRGAGTGEGLVDDRHLDRRQAATAVRDRPGRAQPASGPEPARPLLDRGRRGAVVGRMRLQCAEAVRRMVVDEGSDLGAQGVQTGGHCSSTPPAVRP